MSEDGGGSERLERAGRHDSFQESVWSVGRREAADCDALPQHKGAIQYQGAGKLICNSLRGAIVTGFLVLNDRENKRRWDGDGKERGRARRGWLDKMAGEEKLKGEEEKMRGRDVFEVREMAWHWDMRMKRQRCCFLLVQQSVVVLLFSNWNDVQQTQRFNA